MKSIVIGISVVWLSVGIFTPSASGDPGPRFGPPPPRHLSESASGRAPGGPPWGPPAEETREGRPDSELCGAGFFPVLNLDEKQLEKVRVLERGLAKAEIPRGAELEVAQIELEEILEREPVNLKVVEAKLKKMEALRTMIQLAQIQFGEEIKSLLTPSQKKAWKQRHPTPPADPGFHSGGQRMAPPGEPVEFAPPGTDAKGSR
jgi:Spy/CpxP family protein refolding chaperone